MQRLNKFVTLIIYILCVLLLIACDRPDPAEVRARNNLPNPDYISDANRGWQLFDSHCAVCHGATLQGTNKGPPLLHKIYRPGHHADLTFFWAMGKGVQQHHWKFGNMPPQPQISPEQAADIVTYIRQKQRAEGIK